LADIAANARNKALGKQAAIAPLALEAVERIDAIFDVEREINGPPAAERLAVRKGRIAPLVADLEPGCAASARVCRAMLRWPRRWIIYSNGWSALTRFLHDGRICLTNNCAERNLRGVALGRKSLLLCGSDRGGERAAMIYTVIATAKINGVDPQAWLADLLACINEHKITDLAALLPWRGAATRESRRLAA
jgi:transposase